MFLQEKKVTKTQCYSRDLVVGVSKLSVSSQILPQIPFPEPHSVRKPSGKQLTLAASKMFN